MTEPAAPAARTTRAQRMTMPLARQVVKDLAVEHGACVRPIQLRRTNLDTGEVEQVLVPCGHTLAHVCPSCAERARTLRAVQCREGWHLEEPTSRMSMGSPARLLTKLDSRCRETNPLKARQSTRRRRSTRPT